METTIDVTDKSQVAEVRRVVTELGKRNGMLAADIARAALIATETASNQVKYGKSGTTAASWFEEDGASGIQIIALDQGPGFSNFAAAARDGYSTGGSLGFGLGTIIRTADVFDQFSMENAGAAIFARIYAGGSAARPSPAEQLTVGSRLVPKPGQLQSGDDWGQKHTERWQWLCIVDGLGHGPLASSAAMAAVTRFLRDADEAPPVEVMACLDEALKSTRGAVVALAAIDLQESILLFSGIGNITASIITGDQAQHLPSSEGIVGYNIRRLRQYQYDWKPQSTLIMNTDGISNRWNFAQTPGLLAKHPALIAAVLHRDFSRQNDDSCIVIAKVFP